MKAIVVFFDSLSRHYLPPYGNEWVEAPNFERLAGRCATFDRCYVGSMPCIPGRRDFHTGRGHFLHRSWGPLEPFDDSMPAALSKAGIHTHLATDHYHYWEDGGATYHNRYSTYDFVRGQESDKWIGSVRDPSKPDHIRGIYHRQHWANRPHMEEEAAHPITRTFDCGLDFLRRNAGEENWFLQIECFSPHPPFCASQRFRKKYGLGAEKEHFDWPPYAPRGGEDSDEAIDHLRREYAAVVTQCDHALGRVMDFMDENRMWEDTLLLVTTDHGFLLGEHDWYAFVKPPFWDEVAVKPLFLHDPRFPAGGERRDALVQTVDCPATLLDFFGQPPFDDMEGKPLQRVLEDPDGKLRDYAIFGVFGGHVNVTDGRYVYMRGPAEAENGPLFQYTLLPLHMRQPFPVRDLGKAELAPPFSFTKGCPLLKIPGQPFMSQPQEWGTLLYDLEKDPQQRNPIKDEEIERRMMGALTALMKANDAPVEQYARLGLPN